MTTDSSLRSLVLRIGDLLPWKDFGVPKERFELGMELLAADLMRLGHDAHVARVEGLAFWQAAEQRERFPFLRRVHLAVTDLLQWEVPAELVDWLQQALHRPQPIAEDLMHAIAHAAMTASTPPLERALMQFLLYEGSRMNVVMMAWLNADECSFAGLRLQDVDRLAEDKVNQLLAIPGQELGDEDPWKLLFAAGMVDLTQAVDQLRRALTQQGCFGMLLGRAEAVREAMTEARLRALPLPEATLLRNKIAPELREQRVPVELLQEDHPLALEGMSRDAMDQRVKRAGDQIKAGCWPVRRQKAFIDHVRDAIASVDSGDQQP